MTWGIILGAVRFLIFMIIIAAIIVGLACLVVLFVAAVSKTKEIIGEVENANNKSSGRNSKTGNKNSKTVFGRK